MVGQNNEPQPQVIIEYPYFSCYLDLNVVSYTIILEILMYDLFRVLHLDLE